ncbi:SYQ [Hepatospora eriocheir]|uniref:SYQ n=1 Tax=Hepatospora eriocheir TaxID=1081669 RepID=A0A1X0QEH3_9MICR|nr:SYQ [Hepatospora eriocheir]
MRRRGIPPSAINKFVQSVGITISDTIIDVKIFESFIFIELFKTSKITSCITDPIKVYLNCEKQSLYDYLKISSKVIYIDGSDFMEKPTDDFLRLTPYNSVGLIGLGEIKFKKFENDGIRCDFIPVESEVFSKPKKFIQWIYNLDFKVELRMYSSLFKSFNPEEVGYLNDIDLENSLKVVDGYCNSEILESKLEDRYQFIRKGFFCCDKDSDFDKKKLVFNKTLGLKNFK